MARSLTGGIDHRAHLAIEGCCDGRFQPLRTAFERNFHERDEIGAALCVVLEGHAAVDLWGGWRERTAHLPWERDTLVDVFSVGKGMTSACALHLVQQGKLALDSAVADIWPEFAAAGKASISVRQLLSHQAGLPAIRKDMPHAAMLDWTRMTSALAETAPWWEPGSRHGYHVNTYGFLIGELVRRLTGKSLGRYFHEIFADPLELDFFFGIGDLPDRRMAEYVHLLEDTEHMPLRWEGPDGTALSPEQQELIYKAHNNPPGFSGNGMVNRRDWREAEIPSTGAHGNARAVARFYAALVGAGTTNVRPFSNETLSLWTREESYGLDALLGRPTRFGLGIQLPQPGRPLGPSPLAFGHFGAGGALGFADPDARLGFGYVMNRMTTGWQNPKNLTLLEALYDCL